MSEGTNGTGSPDPRAEDRAALRELMTEVTHAINRKDWEALDHCLMPNVVVTMIDQCTLHGREDLSTYVESKLGQYSSILSDLQVNPIPDAPATFYGDTAVCTLSSADRFIFRNGKEFLVQNRYTATLLKQDGSWRLAALHGGCNAFNNPISYQLQPFLVSGLALAGAGGALVGYLLGKKS